MATYNLLIMDPDYNLLLDGTNQISTPDFSAADDNARKNRIRTYFSSMPIYHLISGISNDRIIIKTNDNPAGTTHYAAIIFVTNEEKNSLAIAAPNKWADFLKIKSDSITVTTGITASTLLALRTNFASNVKLLYDGLKEARNASIPPLAVFEKEPESIFELVYDFFGRSFWRRRVSPVIVRRSPVIVDVLPITPMFLPTITTNYNSPTRIGKVLTPSSDSNMFEQSTRGRTRSPRGTSPRVPRSPRGSPRMGRRGGFYEKYMKYKTKYLELKAKLGK